MGSPEARHDSPDTRVREGEKIRFVRTKTELARLIKNNPATGIFVQSTYDRIANAFNPRRCAPIDYVLVETFNEVKEFFIDGHHRGIVGLDKFDEIMERNPDFAFTFYDATEEVLNNPAIVPPDTKGDRTMLTIGEYQKALREHTIEHAEILHQRMGLHFLKGWADGLDPKITEKFSGLAALFFLNTITKNVTSEEQALIALDEHPTFFATETEKDRKDVRKGLATIVRNVYSTKNLSIDRVLEDTLYLITTKPDAIGGSKGITKEIHGILFHPMIYAKIQKEFTKEDERVHAFQMLEQQLVKAFSTIANPLDKKNLYGNLLDQRITITDLQTVLNAKPDSLKKEIQHLINDYNKNRLLQAYQKSYGAPPESSSVTILIKNIGTKIKEDEDLYALSFLIHKAAETLHEASSIEGEMSKKAWNNPRIQRWLNNCKKLSKILVNTPYPTGLSNNIEAIETFTKSGMELLADVLAEDEAKKQERQASPPERIPPQEAKLYSALSVVMNLGASPLSPKARQYLQTIITESQRALDRHPEE